MSSRLLVTVALLVVALAIILIPGDSTFDALATLIVGTVMGYWLHDAERSIPPKDDTQ
jgi:uncharacterized membrane protein YjjP (DUF1212 family)